MNQPSMAIGSIVIVEDEPVVRSLMRLWLEAEGYEVIEYSTGQEAALLDTEGTAAVCLDLRLEDMSGQSVLSELRARDPELPVIVVTGDQDLETAATAMRAGAYDYVVKPFDRERLAQAVKRAVERRALWVNVQKLQRELGTTPGFHPASPVSPMSPATMLASAFDASTLNLRELERVAIARALELCGGSVGKAAKLLGIGRATLYRRLSEQRSPLGSEPPMKLNGHEIARS